MICGHGHFLKNLLKVAAILGLAAPLYYIVSCFHILWSISDLF